MLPRNKAILSLLALATLTTAPLVAESAYAQESENKPSLRLQLAHVRRNLAMLKNGVTELSGRLGVQKAVPTPAQSAPAQAQATIGKNTDTKGWITFDFYPGRTSEAVSYHNATSIGVAFRIREGGKLAQEYRLDFPFAERTPEQRAADIFMIQNCIADFHRVSSTDGGAFYIQASSDPKLGLLCSSTK